MHQPFKFALGLSALLLATQAGAQITFYEGEAFRGKTFFADKPVESFQREGFNDSASSVIVDHGRWEVCEDARFKGRCMVLRRGSYDSLSAMGMNNRISSVRPVALRTRYDNEAPEPLEVPNYDYRRRPGERLFQAPVTSVRAVVGQPEQRCWVEHQQVSEPSRGPANVGGALAGALIGGIIGHQVGGGVGRNIATAGGAVAGGMIGSNVGRNNTSPASQDVRRCENVPSTQPEYWDVSYKFRSIEHHIQMKTAPGSSIAVNDQGEPRQ